MSQKSLHAIKETLDEHGLKSTHQRMVIYQTLKDSSAHPTAENIFEKLRRSHPSISLGTVYKTLETFVEKGLIKRVKTSE